MADRHASEETRRRVVLLVEMDVPKGWSSKGVEGWLREAMADDEVVVWGAIDGVDGAYRKLRQLTKETNGEAPYADRVHSAYKALSFFQDMFPASFWKWKRIGGEHPNATERPMMAGR